MTTTSSTSTIVSPARDVAQSGRLLSVDILRGLTIAFMILVNNNGNEAAAYWPLKHAAWNGFTPTDLVFPTFLFLVGITTVFSTASRLAKGDTKPDLFLHVLRRSIVLYLLGLVVNSFPYFHLHTEYFPA
jgi:predicted acyltransferase